MAESSTNVLILVTLSDDLTMKIVVPRHRPIKLQKPVVGKITEWSLLTANARMKASDGKHV